MIRNSLLGVLVIIFVLMGFFFSGCAKKPAETAAVKEEPVVQVQVQLEEGESVLIIEEESVFTDRHTVRRGECLWWIAQYRNLYDDPFQWPIIYDANKSQIEDPDLIYPGQILSIPRSGYTVDEVKEARKRAGAPRPFTPPEEAFVLTK